MTVRGLVRARVIVAMLAALAPRMVEVASSDHHGSTKLDLRGRSQTIEVYGEPGGPVAIVSSGDGGWVHLAPHVARLLASRGWYVIGFDARAYLASFTEGGHTLRDTDVPTDYASIVDFATRAKPGRPVLIGVSEGAGLSVLAATGDAVKTRVTGILGIGLPDINELGWRWRDMVIYVTHGIPNEPTFSAAGIVSRIAPLPLAAIHSTSDEFVPVADIERLIDRAAGPKKLWLVKAADHRFSDNETELDARVVEALTWIAQNHP
jgi:fermentation-respiration switch protein FrsA (DUF1100 family)